MRAPKKIHLDDGNGRLCGDTTWLTWPEWTMTDKFARKLPKCQKCLDINVSFSSSGKPVFEAVLGPCYEEEVANAYTTLSDYLLHARRRGL